MAIKRLVSIVIPAYNEEQFLGELLHSIKQFLSIDVEIIVIDNGSTDRTREIASSNGCKVIELENKAYPSIVRNCGAANAGGNLLVFLDSDVLVTSDWCNQLVRISDKFRCDPHDFVTGCQYFISKDPSWIELHWFKPLRNLDAKYINGGNIITTKSVFQKLHGFDEHLETGEDVDFSERAKAQHIPLVFDDAWKVLHEGYPKTSINFIKREAWHGRGDFASLKSALRSRIAVVTIIFLLMHLLLLAGLFAYLVRQSTDDSNMFVILSIVTAIAVLNFAVTKIRFRLTKIPNIFVTCLVNYLYFVGRSMALVSSIGDRIGNIWRRPRVPG